MNLTFKIKTNSLIRRIICFSIHFLEQQKGNKGYTFNLQYRYYHNTSNWYLIMVKSVYTLAIWSISNHSNWSLSSLTSLHNLANFLFLTFHVPCTCFHTNSHKTSKHNKLIQNEIHEKTNQNLHADSDWIAFNSNVGKTIL